jgi:polar amino acid transport system substrate-binding protein
MDLDLRLLRRLAAACLPQLAAPLQAAPPTLHFATKPFAPYAYADANGRAAGPLVELLQAACADTGWHCTVAVLPWRRALGMAERGELDGVFPVVDSAARRSAFHLSPAVLQARYVLVSHQRGTAGPPPGLAGRTVAAYGPSDAATTLRQLAEGQPGVRVAIEPDHQTVLRKLLAGRYGDDGLALVNEAVAKHLRDTGDMHALQAVGVVKPLRYAYALVPQRVGSAQAQAFAAAVAALCRSGQASALLRRHALPAADGCRATITPWHKANASPQTSTSTPCVRSGNWAPPPSRPD